MRHAVNQAARILYVVRHHFMLAIESKRGVTK
jgi:hypothetical protein